MKKILYIIPIVVLAMVGLTQDAKAQSNPPVVTGQTGNASNGGTIITANTAGINSVVGLGSGNESNVPNALIVVDGTFVQTVNPPTNAPVVIFQRSGGISELFTQVQETPLSNGAINKVVGGSSVVEKVQTLSSTNTDYSVTVTADHHALITKFLIGS